MDKITHEVRLANWKNIIEQCNNRPKGTTIKQWLTEHDINDKTYYYWLRRVRQEVYSKMNANVPSVMRESETEPVTFAEIPLMSQKISASDSFQADAIIRSGDVIVGISNSISDRLLDHILEVTKYAR